MATKKRNRNPPSAAKTYPNPDLCTDLRIHRDVAVAIGEFRKRRLAEGKDNYVNVFPSIARAADTIIEELGILLGTPVDRMNLQRVVADKRLYAAFRSLSAPPISEDDFETLIDATINPRELARNQDVAERIVGLVKQCIDPHRFPWVAAGREPLEKEKTAAKLATAVLTFSNSIQTARRNEERDALEGRVGEILDKKGYVKRKKPRGGVSNVAEWPDKGAYFTGCKLHDHSADFVVRLFDGRLLLIECKASNSKLNGIKRLNKEVENDARAWLAGSGGSNIVVIAALRGVFGATKIQQVQNQHVFIVWSHRMRALHKFLNRVGGSAEPRTHSSS